MIKKHWKSLLFALLVAGALVGLFNFLGGFEQPQFEVYTRPAGVLSGYYYEGPIKNPAFGRLFNQAETSRTASGGMVSACYINNPDTRGDTAVAVVGLYYPGDTAGFAADTLLPVSAAQVLKVSIKASYLVAGKLYEKSREYAQTHNLSIALDRVHEYYPQDGGVIIEFLTEE